MTAPKDLDNSDLTARSSSGTALQRYHAVQHDLALVQRVGDVKDVRDRALAMEKYAKEAKNTELVDQAVETRLRAERRAGEILADMMQRGERDNGRGNRNPTLRSQKATPKLSDLGISKSQSSRWQHLASLTEEEFESKVEHAKCKALRAIDGKGKPVRKIKRETRRVSTDPHRVCEALRILSAAPSAEIVAASGIGNLKDIVPGDIARAIAFLQQLQHALCPAERHPRGSYS